MSKNLDNYDILALNIRRVALFKIYACYTHKLVDLKGVCAHPPFFSYLEL